MYIYICIYIYGCRLLDDFPSINRLPIAMLALALVIKLLQFFGAVCGICTWLPHSGSPPGCGLLQPTGMVWDDFL